ncbi:MAG: Transcriptional regulator, IclR family [Caulobacteraceae bacterium]|nr:Transcriptional regulator, IclR family [Caulobacteraceae bacterium]
MSQKPPARAAKPKDAAPAPARSATTKTQAVKGNVQTGAVRSESDVERSGGRSVARTCAILRLIGQGDDEGVSLLDVGAATDLPKSSAHRYLQVLEAEGFVERDPRSSRYRLGIGLMALQTGFIDRLIQRTRPFLAKVRDRYDETVNLGMLVGHQIVYLDILESARTMRLAARKGDTELIHATALGKAIAATLPDQEVVSLLRRTGMPKLTDRTMTTPEEFLHELERVRACGYAIDDCENEPEGRCVAVFVPGLRTPTAVSLSGVASRFPIERTQEVADSLRVAAMEISGENISPMKPLERRRA